MRSLAGLSAEEIKKLLPTLPAFRADQIYKWILRGADSFDKMTDLPLNLRDELKKSFSVYSSKIEEIFSDDSAEKIVIALQDGQKIEAVLLKDNKNRLTACLSTQVGCPAACVFCKTGTLGFKRNLTSCEIIEQFLHLNNNYSSGSSSFRWNDSWLKINNIVIMGMGEPLLNLVELRKAITFFTDPQGMNFSRRRITVSTCGICDGLFDIAANGPFVRLALSLTTADEALRQKLMPITAANPLPQVREALAACQKNGAGRITLEVPLLGGINTADKDAKLIADFAAGLDVVVNVIPWNPVADLAFEGKPLREPSKEETENFIRLLESSGMKVTMRHKKGRRIAGACGQLGS